MMALCTNCERKPAHTRGLCRACYGYLARTGQQRPPEGIHHRTEQRTCANCGHTAQGTYTRFSSTGLCELCHKFLQRNGRHRTPQDHKPWGRNVGRCTHCHLQQARHAGMCVACYKYQHKHGKPRPRNYFYKPEACKNCGKPDTEADRLVKSRCHNCYTYWRKHKEERPEKWWKRVAPLGYCDCGQPGVAVVRLTVGNPFGKQYTQTEEDYLLCAICIEEAG